MKDPEWFFRKNSEEARLDPENPYILSDHIRCAAFELPFSDQTLENGNDTFPADSALPVLEYLEEAGIVRHTSENTGLWHWADRSYPSESISLRSAASGNVVIIDVTEGRNRVIGEMDRVSAKQLIFDNAVYMHRGNQYLVEKLDIENRKCFVIESEVNYYTDSVVKTDIKVLAEDENFSYRTADAVLGDVLVRTHLSKFKKLTLIKDENIGYGFINLPEEEMQTRALMILFDGSKAGGKALGGFNDARAGAALSGAGTLIKNIAPVYILCDPRDIGIAEMVRDPHFGVPALYVYDQYPGGTGLAESLARLAEKLFDSVFRAVDLCPCKSGCPSCVGPAGDKKAVRILLGALAGSRV